jgi:hypothetical protein
MRADEILETGDMEGQLVWKQVLNAIEALTSSDPGGVVH